MRKIVLIAGILLVRQVASAQGLDEVQLQTGDLLFQDLDCGPMCDAIEAVTEGFDGKDFSHTGLVYLRNDSVYVIEAIGKDVHLTPLAVFAQRSGDNKIYAGRLKPEYRGLIKKATDYALTQAGVAYDDVFLYDNGKYYCSELIYDAFKKANHNKPFFVLEPMTFREPGGTKYFTVWADYYKDLKEPIPEGKPGINPGGLSRSDKITILNK